ncbi:hypothetical protein MP638_005255 [Amoeboaphelidium occidentale]|nr:hypothetical protein MP638_005255 [Amoeboaphelidium occidentale]
MAGTIQYTNLKPYEDEYDEFEYVPRVVKKRIPWRKVGLIAALSITFAIGMGVVVASTFDPARLSETLKDTSYAGSLKYDNGALLTQIPGAVFYQVSKSPFLSKNVRVGYRVSYNDKDFKLFSEPRISDTKALDMFLLSAVWSDSQNEDPELPLTFLNKTSGFDITRAVSKLQDICMETQGTLSASITFKLWEVGRCQDQLGGSSKSLWLKGNPVDEITRPLDLVCQLGIPSNYKPDESRSNLIKEVQGAFDVAKEQVSDMLSHLPQNVTDIGPIELDMLITKTKNDNE